MDYIDYINYVETEKNLDYYREVNKNVRMQWRLRGLPFINPGVLFNLDWRTHHSDFPCIAFSQQLVHKIIDELIYCGLNPIE